MWTTIYARHTAASPQRIWELLADGDGWDGAAAGTAATHTAVAS